MPKAIVKLTYRHIIDSSASTAFEKSVLSSSYQEFLLKSQVYNPESRFKTFSEMKRNDGRANSLHYKLSFSVGHFIESLQKKIPVLTDALGKSIDFETPQLELIESDITDIATHQLAIHYTTGELNLLDIVGEYLILSAEDGGNTFTIKMQDNLAISYYREVVKSATNEHGVLAA